MTSDMVESTWAKNMGYFLYHLDTDVRKTTRRLKSLHLKIQYIYVCVCISVRALVLGYVNSGWVKEEIFYGL